MSGELLAWQRPNAGKLLEGSKRIYGEMAAARKTLNNTVGPMVESQQGKPKIDALSTASSQSPLGDGQGGTVDIRSQGMPAPDKQGFLGIF